MATVFPGPEPSCDQHFGWRRPDGSGWLFAAEPGDAHGGRESSELEEDRWEESWKWKKNLKASPGVLFYASQTGRGLEFKFDCITDYITFFSLLQDSFKVKPEVFQMIPRSEIIKPVYRNINFQIALNLTLVESYSKVLSPFSPNISFSAERVHVFGRVLYGLHWALLVPVAGPNVCWKKYESRGKEGSGRPTHLCPRHWIVVFYG